MFLLAHTSSKGEKLGMLRVEKLTLFTHERALLEMIRCNLKVTLLLSVLAFPYECNHSGKDTTRWHWNTPPTPHKCLAVVKDIQEGDSDILIE